MSDTNSPKSKHSSKRSRSSSKSKEFPKSKQLSERRLKHSEHVHKSKHNSRLFRHRGMPDRDIKKSDLNILNSNKDFLDPSISNTEFKRTLRKGASNLKTSETQDKKDELQDKKDEFNSDRKIKRTISRGISNIKSSISNREQNDRRAARNTSPPILLPLSKKLSDLDIFKTMTSRSSSDVKMENLKSSGNKVKPVTSTSVLESSLVSQSLTDHSINKTINEPEIIQLEHLTDNELNEIINKNTGNNSVDNIETNHSIDTIETNNFIDNIGNTIGDKSVNFSLDKSPHDELKNKSLKREPKNKFVDLFEVERKLDTKENTELNLKIDNKANTVLSNQSIIQLTHIERRASSNNISLTQNNSFIPPKQISKRGIFDIEIDKVPIKKKSKYSRDRNSKIRKNKIDDTIKLPSYYDFFDMTPSASPIQSPYASPYASPYITPAISPIHSPSASPYASPESTVHLEYNTIEIKAEENNIKPPLMKQNSRSLSQIRLSHSRRLRNDEINVLKIIFKYKFTSMKNDKFIVILFFNDRYELHFGMFPIVKTEKKLNRMSSKSNIELNEINKQNDIDIVNIIRNIEFFSKFFEDILESCLVDKTSLIAYYNKNKEYIDLLPYRFEFQTSAKHVGIIIAIEIKDEKIIYYMRIFNDVTEIKTSLTTEQLITFCKSILKRIILLKQVK